MNDALSSSNTRPRRPAIPDPQTSSRRTPPRLDHGAIGNGRVLALVSPSSAIEWLCLPRFDSPSVFARLLDRERGGTYRILASGREVAGSLKYLTNTNVLCTTFAEGDAEWEVIDFAPRMRQGQTFELPLEIVRIVRPLRGHARLSIDFDPRPDYARAQVQLTESASGIAVLGGPGPISLATNLPVPYVLERREFVLQEPLFFSLLYGEREGHRTLASAQHDLEVTIAGWREWSKRCYLPSFAPEAVLRSALCLKLHAYQPTGAIIAAATTSIPEAWGSLRTWDYRHCWLRDSAFVVEALRRIGQLHEGEQFIHFLRNVAEVGPLQPVYGVTGERILEEQLLPHLAGFDGCHHVRIGNAAALQHQNDLMGEVLVCLHTLLTDPRLVYDDPQLYWPLIERLVEEAISRAPTPDTGIWEYRTILRANTFSRSMCWVAIQRGAALAHKLGHHEHAARWQAIADREREIVLTKSYNAEIGIFAQTLGGADADAANLLLATIGIVEARDPRFKSTVEVSGKILADRGLLVRYRNADDFGVMTTAFTVCSFWWAEALALIGRLDEAVALFQRLIAYANPVGLMSEDIDPETGALLGNFPQAYTHVGLINAAATIGELLDARDGRIRAWS